MNRPELSIIIPCLNEEDNLARLLKEIQRQKNLVYEILVVDGGSQDHSCKVAVDAGATVLHTKAGRGHQMNEGAKVAQYKLLFFLHADSYIDDDHLLHNAVMQLQSQGSHQIAGHFSLKFIRSDTKKSLAYFYYEEKAKLNREYVFGGDQGLLISKDFFEEIGKFNEDLHFLEDKKISFEIAKKGKLITLSGSLGTSARRFETEGFSRRMVLAALIIGLFHISYQPFFNHARDLYKQQDKSSRLHIHRFFYLIYNINRRNTWTIFLRDWYGIGRFVRENVWQVFFLGDICLRYFCKIPQMPLLTFYDKIIFPLTNFWLFDVIMMVIVYILFHIFWGYFWFADKLLPIRKTM